jgi:hypothetical protein
MSERMTGENSLDGIDFIDIYCMCYDVSLYITSSFYSSSATPSHKNEKSCCCEKKECFNIHYIDDRHNA